MDWVLFLASVVAAAPPLLLAVLGETLTEKSGVINLSLDGTLILSALAAFAAACATQSIAAGFAAGMAAGALIALLVAWVSLSLRQSQVATGFVLALFCRDLAYVLGRSCEHQPGPQVAHLPIPGLAEVPVLGPILFSHDVLVYVSLAAVPLAWVFLYRTRWGLSLRAAGDQPAAAFARGVAVTRVRYVYALAGGAFVGCGGAAFSLLVKPGWARPYGIEGTGWIVLALVVFGGWHPLRGAVGALLFVALQNAAGKLQGELPGVPVQLLSTLPFPLMMATLVFVTVSDADWLQAVLRRLPEEPRRLLAKGLRLLRAAPPAALGEVFEEERPRG